MKYYILILCCIIININTQNAIDKNILFKNHDSYITNDDECKTDFECRNSACCKNGKCKESKECYKDVKLMYIIFAGIGFLFLIAVIIYFICQINSIRNNVKFIQLKNSRSAKRSKKKEEKRKKEEEEKKKKEEEKENENEDINIKNKGSFMKNVLKLDSHK
jgi:hypothetical protein